MLKKKNELEYYSLDRINEIQAQYYIIFGERSNGKTTAVLAEGLRKHIFSGYTEQLAIIRRWELDFKGKNGEAMFSAPVFAQWIEKWSQGKYNGVRYYSQRWYLCHFNDEGERDYQSDSPFAFGFALSQEEHYKSTSYPNITTVLFDEFITRNTYLPNEFITFQNILSTIIRDRDNVKIYMCGNTVNKFCPYWNEMGLTNVRNQKMGTIDIYTYGESEMTVALEYCGTSEKNARKNLKKGSNKYFAFDNPKLKMITNGTWEIDIYPHLPHKYTPKECIYKFFIIFDSEVLQGNIITLDESGETFIYYHRKTTPIQENDTELIYQQEIDYRKNYRINMLKPYGRIDTKILKLYMMNKFFYQDNEVGDIIYNYLNWCKQN